MPIGKKTVYAILFISLVLAGSFYFNNLIALGVMGFLFRDEFSRAMEYLLSNYTHLIRNIFFK